MCGVVWVVFGWCYGWLFWWLCSSVCGGRWIVRVWVVVVC